MTRICQQLQVPLSSYYDWQQRVNKPPCPVRKAKLAAVREIDIVTHSSYGARRVAQELTLMGWLVGRYHAATLMAEAGVEALVPKPPLYPKVGGTESLIAQNLLNREFDVEQLGTVYAGDITYIWTTQGWLYLAIVMDLCSRKIVGWAFSSNPNTDLVIRALRLALGQRKAEGELMFHSDQGCQYSSHRFVKYLAENQITQSMSRRGNCWDNAPVERFFRSLKTERIRKKAYTSHSLATQDVSNYIAGFYNTRRRHSTNGGVSPLEFEQNLTNAA